MSAHLESIEYHLTILNLSIFLCLYEEYGKVRRQKNQSSGSGESGQVHGTEGKGLGHSQISQIWSMGEGSVTNGVYPNSLFGDTQFSPHHLLVRLWFVYCDSRPLCQHSIEDLGFFFFYLSVLYHQVMSVFMPGPHWSGYCNFTICFEARKCNVSSFVFFSSRQVWLLTKVCKSTWAFGFFYLSSEVYLIETVLIHISHWVTWVS